MMFYCNLLLLLYKEVEKLRNAMKKKEFRDLLVDYVKEIEDPENKKVRVSLEMNLCCELHFVCVLISSPLPFSASLLSLRYMKKK